MYFQVFPWPFCFMREHSLVELAEHDKSAADIMVLEYLHIFTAAFIVHSVDAAAEPGRNPVSKHQIQPEYGDE